MTQSDKNWLKADHKNTIHILYKCLVPWNKPFIMSFKQHSLHTKRGYTSWSQPLTSRMSSPKQVIMVVAIVVSSGLIMVFSKWIVDATKRVALSTSKVIVNAASQTLGTPMIKDDLWNINVLLLGYGGGKHQGALLTDSIIVASYDEKLWSVSMLSLPRDLYVLKNKKAWYGKINGMLSTNLGISDGLDQAALLTISKIEEVVWVKIPYYIMIDFQWFESIVNTLGGIDIFVPKNFIDPAYPVDRNGTYTTFRVNSGQQIMDGPTALKYVRSRHSTSDFSRSARQRDVIKSIINKALKTENVTNISVLRELYNQYSKIVTTNVTYQEMLWMVPNLEKMDHVISNGLTSECGYGWYKMMKAGCFLYTPNSALVGGASVLLPNGSTINNPSIYKYIQNYAFFALHNQWYQIENPSIEVVNAIGSNAPRTRYIRRVDAGIDMAVKLMKFNFNIQGSRFLAGRNNTKEQLEETIVKINGTGNTYPETLKVLNMILDIDRVETWADLSWFDMQIFLGNSYVQKYGNELFNINQ